ncbi:MJ0042-type zinc finger domain-containing protein [Planctomicrobium sp. SH668]|uniref:MJ0042-type zinc finger domain-containing protein n=1 Tax=Planctomicrobium sp. SH668 TaxID=3448126 RepID=UPI003F5C1A54
MSTAVSLHCPHCETKLKIKDDSLFGRSVKCPGCKQPFVLRNPNEPAADATSVPEPVDRVEETDSPKATAPSPAESAPAFPDFSQPSANAHTNAQPGAFNFGEQNPFTDPNPFTAPPATKQKPASTLSPFSFDAVQQPKSSGSSPLTSSEGDETAESDYISARKARQKKAQLYQYAVFGVIGIACAGVIAFMATRQPAAVSTTATQPVARNEAVAPKVIPRPTHPNAIYSKALLESDPELAAEFRPTHGDPIQLLMMPNGVNMVIHLRPAELWSDEYDFQVLRASLTDEVTEWIADTIKTFCRRDPSQIESLTLGVLFSGRGAPPQYCAAVTLKEPEKLTSLLDSFPGKYLYEITDRPDLRIKIDETQGYLIKDERNYAICPVSLASDLEYSVNRPNQDVSAAMEEMLKTTDRQRLFSVVADLRDLDIYAKELVPGPALQFVTAVRDWFGEDIEMAKWSMHPTPYLHSEFTVLPVTTMRPMKLKSEMASQLQLLPKVLWRSLCIKMHPQEVRFRKLIGRLPAMIEAFQRSTVISDDTQHVSFTTVLPAKATPNLSLATLFTINEAARTNFSTAVTTATDPAKPKLPESVVDRLNTIVDAEFARTPFEQAVTFLCDEIQVKVFVDGDALKDAGYTKNMPQTFNLGKVPMKKALSKIVNSYQEAGKEMVISIDEKTKTITVTTLKFAGQNNQPVFDLKPE